MKNSKRTPCYNCTERHENCHGSCEKYKEFTEYVREYNKYTREASYSLSDYEHGLLRSNWNGRRQNCYKGKI